MTKPLPYVLVLRKVRKNMTSHKGFLWPSKGVVKAPDWSNYKECGHGLHGFLWGRGDDSALPRIFANRGGHWLVVRVRKNDIVNLDGKVKFKEGVVVFCGKLDGAAKFIGKDSACPSSFNSGCVIERWKDFSHLNPKTRNYR
jgi:hypothetical protein